MSDKIKKMMSFGYSERDASIFVRANGRCEYCGVELINERLAFDAVQFDHIIPKSKGGNEDADNIAFSCQICNTAKHTYIPSGKTRGERIADAKSHIANRREHANIFWSNIRGVLR